MKKIEFNEEKCKGCGLCVIACPKKLVSLNKNKINKKGHNPADVVEKDKCVACGQCAVMCPDNVIYIEK